MLFSIDDIPGCQARALITSSADSVFAEDVDQLPLPLGKFHYMPWGVANDMPYKLQKLISDDETMATCQQFNAEICYGAGVEFDTCIAPTSIKTEVDSFQLFNDIPYYWMGVCQDMKMYGFAISVILLSRDGSRITDIVRKEACYCRFSPANERGEIDYLLYGNFKKSSLDEKEVEVIPMLSQRSPWQDLTQRIASNSPARKFAIITKAPSPDNRYYPIPPYTAVFRGKWYHIKQLIGIAKEAKLKNHAPIKYQIEVADRYWQNILKAENITDKLKQRARIIEEKNRMLDFLTGAENSGKALFSTYYVSVDGKEQHDVVITRIDQSKEGGDWETDIQEAINMLCFTMRVHSNLVGSVPGKSQSNNSGSDKRELYTIAQALQKPYRDLLLQPLSLIIRYNVWTDVSLRVPFIQLTTLDEHRDAKQVILPNS